MSVELGVGLIKVRIYYSVKKGEYEFLYKSNLKEVMLLYWG